MNCRAWKRLFRRAAVLVCAFLAVVGSATADIDIDWVELERRIARAHAHRLELLKRASGAGTIYITFNPSDEMIETSKRLLSERGATVDDLQFAGSSVVHFSWRRDGEKVRFDKDIGATPEEFESFFGTAHVRAAADAERLLFLDLVNSSAAISRPTIVAGNPSAIHSWLDIADLYSFTFTPVVDVIDGMNGEALGPTKVHIYEDAFQGIPCVAIELSAKLNYSDKVWNVMSSSIRVAPQQGYSVLSRRFESEWFHVDHGGEVLTVREGTAKYVESERFPGVWLVQSMFMHLYEKEIGLNETVSVVFDSFEIGSNVPRETFSFQGLGVPLSAPVVDRRFPGESRMYRYGGDRSIDLDTPLLIGLKQTLPDLPGEDAGEVVVAPDETARETGAEVGESAQSSTGVAIGGSVLGACTMLAVGVAIWKQRSKAEGIDRDV